jgi:protein associated with RNAse G/E
MIKLKDLLLENSETNTFQMYHGGKRWSVIPSELYSHKQGRYECGVGIYLTNDYNTARKYAKGSRVVHLVDIDKNFKELGDIKIPLTDILEFVKNLSGLKHKSEIITALTNNAIRMNTDYVRGDILNNLIVNYEAGSGNVGIKISNYFVSKGADAKFELQSGDEYWLVIFNPNIIKKVTVVDASKVDSNFPFVLPNPYL